MPEPRKYCFYCMHELPEADGKCTVCGSDNRERRNGGGELPFCRLAGKYLVGHAIARGGFGITYVGLDEMENRRPLSLDGNLEASRTVLSHLGFLTSREWADSGNSSPFWGVVGMTKNEYTLSQRQQTPDNKVPDVKGMTLGDAAPSASRSKRLPIDSPRMMNRL